MKYLGRVVFMFALLVYGLTMHAQETWPVDTIDGQAVYKYRVPRSIGLYRVSVTFNVTQEEIIKWNPQLKERGLHYDEIINVPVNDKNKQFLPEELTKPQPAPEPEVSSQQSEVSSQPEEISSQPEEPVLAVAPELQDSVIAQDSVVLAAAEDSVALTAAEDTVPPSIKIALLLPLQVGQHDAASQRFVDFYEGCLLALHDVQANQKFDLYVYDTGKNEDKIQSLIADSSLKQMDAIIGPAYPNQVAALAPIVLEDSILTVVPFTDRVPDIINNPFLMQFNPRPQSQAAAVGTYLESRKDSVNMVFVDGREADIPYFIRELRQQVYNRGISYTRTSIKDILADSLFKALKDSVENILVFNSEKFSNLQVLLPHVIIGKGDRQVTLFSQYSWQKERIILPQIYTSVFATDLPADQTEYDTLYATYFKHEHASELPRFDLLGYDLMRQLVAFLEGKEYFGLQSDIRFERVNEFGGFINTHVQIVRK